jgi:hypothetical protein
LLPVTVIVLPIAPDPGVTPLIDGCVVTVKFTPLLANPPTLTTTNPDVAPAGTGAVMLVVLQLEGTASVPLNVTVLVLCVVPKFDPLMVTVVPTAPEAGDRPVMFGLVTVKLAPVLATPPAAVTTTLPEVAPPGTVAVMLVLLQEFTVAATPLKVTPPLPCEGP